MRLITGLLALAISTSGVVTKGRFSVDTQAVTAAAAVATTQPRTGAPGYTWLRVYFYPSALSAADSAPAAQGRVDGVTQKWNAVLQFTVDRAGTVWQIDLSIPGHQCTVAASDREAKGALQEFQLDVAHVRLRSLGTHTCDMKSLGLPDQHFAWDVDLDVPVVSRGGGRSDR